MFLYGKRESAERFTDERKKRKKELKKGKKQIKITPEQKKDLKALCEAIKAAATAKKLRERFKAFVDDNEEALRTEDGLLVDGLKVTLKISKQLNVSDAD